MSGPPNMNPNEIDFRVRLHRHFIPQFHFKYRSKWWQGLESLLFKILIYPRDMLIDKDPDTWNEMSAYDNLIKHEIAT